jgi:hypothetical protein
VAEEVIDMFVVLAFALLLVPLATLFVFERMARSGKGPLAEPDRMILLDGAMVPIAAPVLALASPDPVRPADAEQCAAESRLVAALLAGELDRTEYRERMAELAASDAAIRPVRLPPMPL